MNTLNRRRFSRNRIVGFALVLVAALIIIGVGYVGTRMYRYSKIQNHFSEIQIGQTKEDVLRIIGSPDETTGCRSDHRECVETFWYYGYIERWAVYFDKHGRVIDRNYNVSP